MNRTFVQSVIAASLLASGAAMAAADTYVIDPNLCTECVGFHGHEACQAVCPVECCIPDPNNRETEEDLLQRAMKLHPNDKSIPVLALLTGEKSLFRNEKRK